MLFSSIVATEIIIFFDIYTRFNANILQCLISICFILIFLRLYGLIMDILKDDFKPKIYKKTNV